jgi:hypothetical protein
VTLHWGRAYDVSGRLQVPDIVTVPIVIDCSKPFTFVALGGVFAYVGIEEKEIVDTGLYRTTKAHQDPEGGTYLRPFFVALSELEFSL